MPPLSVDAQVAEINASIDRLVDEAVQIAAINTTATLIEVTPLDTGHARANWIPSVGQPHQGEASDAGAQASGQAELAGYTASKGPAFVSNAAPYVKQLNEGSSTQAPAGFVEAAIEKTVREVDQILARRVRGRK